MRTTCHATFTAALFSVLISGCSTTTTVTTRHEMTPLSNIQPQACLDDLYRAYSMTNARPVRIRVEAFLDQSGAHYAGLVQQNIGGTVGARLSRAENTFAVIDSGSITAQQLNQSDVYPISPTLSVIGSIESVNSRIQESVAGQDTQGGGTIRKMPIDLTFGTSEEISVTTISFNVRVVDYRSQLVASSQSAKLTLTRTKYGESSSISLGGNSITLGRNTATATANELQLLISDAATYTAIAALSTAVGLPYWLCLPGDLGKIDHYALRHWRIARVARSTVALIAENQDLLVRLGVASDLQVDGVYGPTTARVAKLFTGREFGSERNDQMELWSTLYVRLADFRHRTNIKKPPREVASLTVTLPRNIDRKGLHLLLYDRLNNKVFSHQLARREEEVTVPWPIGDDRITARLMRDKVTVRERIAPVTVSRKTPATISFEEST